MTRKRKHFVRFIAFVLCLIIIFLDTANMPVLATTVEETSPITNEQIAEALSNAQIVLDEEDEFSDGTSDVNWDELGNIQSDYDYFSELYAQAVANDPMPLGVDLPGDDMVYLTQKWLNQEYGDVSGFGSVPENGKTGWKTIYGLTRALQYELGITSLADNFGPKTQEAYKKNILSRDDNATSNMYAILQGALWCKGYSPGYNFDYNSITDTVTVDAVFDERVEEAVIEMKTDAGLINPNGVVTLNTMKALLSMDAFKLLKSYGGKEVIREMQQKFNREYEEYIGLMPCDGVYGRSTNTATIYVLQAVEGMPVGVATGKFKTKTQECCPDIPYNRNSSAAKNYSGSYYTDSQIFDFIELLQFGLYANGIGDGTINGVFDTKTRQNVVAFQKKFALPETGKVDITTWLSLFVSHGDQNRSALACDCATKITTVKAKTLYDNGYRYVGRYLTKVPGGLDKDITLEEAQIILDAGLNFFPIYQTVGTKKEYFTAEQGASDANAAIEAARKLGVPNGTIIYFAVDFDANDEHITDYVLPYFAKVHETMEKSKIYKTGVYGVRNVCTRVSNKGYACSSFVSNLSSGFSGNLGFPMPDNWAFDQFATVTIGEGSGSISIDKDGFSGKDTGVGKLDPSVTANIEDLNWGNEDSATVEGPMVEILGYQVPLFNFDMSFSPGDFLTLESDVDFANEEINIIVGLDMEQYSWEKYGIREKPKGEKHTQAYNVVKQVVSSIDGNKQEFANKLQSVKGCIIDKGANFGVDCSIGYIGYLKISYKDGETKVIEGEIAMIGQAYHQSVWPIVSAIVLRFEIQGTIESGLVFRRNDNNGVDVVGETAFALKPSLGVGVNALIANVYAGITGSLNCELEIPVDTLANSLILSGNLAGYFEYSALKWGERYEWTFLEHQFYPSESAQTLSISQDNLKLIEPISQVAPIAEDNPDIFKSNMQIYTKPQIISLDDGKMFMAYIDDDSSRTSENSSVLLYSIFDGRSWSEPQKVLDDYTADFEPSICYDGNGGVHILWQNATAIFEDEVTLDEMAAQIDLSYVHWNGTSFETPVTITSNNNNYEMNHKIVCSGEEISVVWKQNSDNDVFGLTGTNSIHRKQCLSDMWQSEDTLATNLLVVSSLDASYNETGNVIAYATKSGNDVSTITDLEIYYIEDAQTNRLTSNDVADYSVCFLGEELYWISDNSIVMVTNGNVDSKISVLENTGANISDIKVVGNSNGNKAIVWEYENDTNMFFYGSYYDSTTNAFKSIELIDKNSGVVRGWDACLNENGKIEMAYCYGEYQTTARSNTITYGALNLIQKTSSEIYDVAVDPLITYEGDIIAGEEISLFASVYNNGSQPISQFEITVFDTDGNQIDALVVNQALSINENTTLEIPFLLPDNIEKASYTVNIIPVDGSDVYLSDNEAEFTFGYADLAIDNIQIERTDTGRKITVSIKNQGVGLTGDATISILKESVTGDVLGTEPIVQLSDEAISNYIFNIDESQLDSNVSEEQRLFYLIIESDFEEMDYGNNSEIVYLYPDYSLNITAGTGGSAFGSGIYANDSYASISATPSPGYQFEGWYENGVLIAGLPQNCELAVNRNRTLEARFEKTDLEISRVLISGELKTGKNIEFTVTTNGGTMPYSWSFYVSYNGKSVDSELDSTDNTFKYKPEKEGNYTFTIKVKDASGNTATYEKIVRIKSLYKITVDKPLDLSEKIPDGLKITYWDSSDTRVASVNGNGIVTGKRVGTTTVTAVTSGGAKLSWEVEVGFTWWQIFLIFTGIGAIMLPFWVAL